MKKMNLNKKQNLKSFIGMLILAALTIFVSCEKHEGSFTEQAVTENAIIGDYTKLNSTIVNSDNGTPQSFETLKSFIGSELQLSDDGSFKSSTGEGRWIQEGNTLFLNPIEGLTMNFEVQKQDGLTLDLLQKYDSYDDYSDGIIAYTFVKKGSNIGLGQDLLSSIEMWY
jgi:hypothetical protein